MLNGSRPIAQPLRSGTSLAAFPLAGTYHLRRGLSWGTNPLRPPSALSNPCWPCAAGSPPFSGCRWPLTVAIGGGAGPRSAAFQITPAGGRLRALGKETQAPVSGFQMLVPTLLLAGIGTLAQISELGQTRPRLAEGIGAAAGACPAAARLALSCWRPPLIGVCCWFACWFPSPSAFGSLLRSHFWCLPRLASVCVTSTLLGGGQ